MQTTLAILDLATTAFWSVSPVVVVILVCRKLSK
jgi:hypothetical protein